MAVVDRFQLEAQTLFQSVEALQGLALQAVNRLVGAETSFPTQLDALVTLLMFEERKGYATRHGSRCAEASYLFDDFEAPSVFARDIVTGSVAPRRIDRVRDGIVRVWRRQVRREAARHGVSAVEKLFRPIANTAFHSSAFQHRLQKPVRRLLQNQVLLHPEPRFSKPLAWQLLLALVAACDRPAQMPDLAWARLQEVARSETCKADWAGFWELWMLRLAEQTSGFDLTRSFHSKPWSCRLDPPTDKGSNDPICFRADWRADIPPYGPGLFSDGI